MNVQKPTALDNKLTVPMCPTQAAVTAERPFQQQMQQRPGLQRWRTNIRQDAPPQTGVTRQKLQAGVAETDVAGWRCGDKASRLEIKASRLEIKASRLGMWR